LTILFTSTGLMRAAAFDRSAKGLKQPAAIPDFSPAGLALI
jgi:hypothetical protein